MFPARVISRRGNIERPSKSPGLNACDYFLWIYLKSKVHEKKPRTTEDLKQNIREEMAAIPPTMLQRVKQNLQKRLLGECVDNNGRHLTEKIIAKKGGGGECLIFCFLIPICLLITIRFLHLCVLYTVDSLSLVWIILD
jgi:hypothetical protein